MLMSPLELFSEPLVELCAVTARMPPVILRSSHREESTFLSPSPREKETYRSSLGQVSACLCFSQLFQEAGSTVRAYLQTIGCEGWADHPKMHIIEVHHVHVRVLLWQIPQI